MIVLSKKHQRVGNVDRLFGPETQRVARVRNNTPSHVVSLLDTKIQPNITENLERKRRRSEACVRTRAARERS